MRLLAQIMIVCYHICYIWQANNHTTDALFVSVSIPLHIGVVVFVLISGYFRIKPSVKGLIKLLWIFFVYNSFEVGYNIYLTTNLTGILHQLLFISNSHFWFIKTYLFLYLSSPLLNMWLDNSTKKQRLYMVVVFFFVACWMGTTKGDPSMVDGKNLVNFMYLYMVGNLLSEYRNIWQKFNTMKMIYVYITITTIIVIFHYYFFGSIVSKILFRLSFPYSSPIILINSILFFMIMGKMKFVSRNVNYLATSCLAIYLIHGIRPFMPIIHSSITEIIQSFTDLEIVWLLLYFVYSIIVVALCILIDKCLQPFWNILKK